jgi:trigger factor
MRRWQTESNFYFLTEGIPDLKIDTLPLDDQQIKVTVETDAEQLEAAKHRAARNIAKKAKIPGFRPGKAPYNIVERFAGEKTILEDALDILAQEMYTKAIDETGIKPYGPGRLENITSTTPPTFEYVIPLEAEVVLGDYRAIREPYEPPVVSEKEVEQVLDNLRQQQAIIEPVERPAQEGDLVTIRLDAERLEPAEGEPASLIRERSVPIVIQPEKEEGSEETGVEWPYPGFSRNLIGVSPNEEKDVTHTFSEETPFEQLRGKEAKYHFVVENVKSRTLPVLDDEFAHSVGEYDSLEALIKEIRESLEQRALEEYNRDYDDKILNQLISESTIKYPPQMLEHEIESVTHQLEDRLAEQRLDLETYLKSRQMDQEALNKELTPTAETRLKRFLTVFQIAQKENVQVNPQEVQNEALQTLNMYASSLPKQEQRKLASQDVISNLVGSITADKLIQQTVNLLRDIASGKAEQAMSSEAEGQNPTEGTEIPVEESTQATAELPVQEETPPQSEESSNAQPESETGQGE